MTQPEESKIGWPWFVAVGLLSLALRSAFIAQETHDLGPYRHQGPDEQGYLYLAKNLLHGFYTEDLPGERHLGLNRPPAYPVFCMLAGGEQRGPRIMRIYWAQALISSAMPLLIMLLLERLETGRLLTILGGTAAALSPTGIGLTGLVLTDSLFSTFFLLGFTLLVLGVSDGRRWCIGVSAAAFGLATLVKPTSLYWPLAVPVLWWLLARGSGHPVAWRRLGIYLLIQIAISVAWCARNYVKEGTPTFTSIDAGYLRWYSAPKVEEWARVHGPPAVGRVRQNRMAITLRDWADLQGGRISPAALARRERQESWAIFLAHPQAFAASLRQQMIEQITASFTLTECCLAEPSTVHWMMDRLDQLASSMTLLCVNIVLSLAALALPIVGKAGLGASGRRLRFFAALAMFLTYAFFAAIASNTYGTGSRIMYPAQFTLIIGGMLGIAAIAQMRRPARNDKCLEL